MSNTLNILSEETFTSKMDAQNALLTQISQGMGAVVDTEFVVNSVNPVQSKVIQAGLADKVDKVQGKGLSTNDFDNTYKGKLDNVDTTVTASSSNLVTSGAVKTAIDNVPTVTVDSALSSSSENPVQNKIVKAAIDAKYTAADATTSGKGIIQVGSGLEVSDGIISVPSATTSSAGIITLADTITSGDTSHVPTSDAVYNAISSASGAPTFMHELSTITYTISTYSGYWSTNPTTTELNLNNSNRHTCEVKLSGGTSSSATSLPVHLNISAGLNDFTNYFLSSIGASGVNGIIIKDAYIKTESNNTVSIEFELYTPTSIVTNNIIHVWFDVLMK